MDHAQSYLDVHQPHISAGPQPGPTTVTSGTVAHYSQYAHPPLLQPGPATYPSAQASFGPFQYANGVTSSQAGGHPSAVASQVPAQLLPLPPMAPTAQPPPPGAGSVNGGPGYASQPFDSTGQIAPSGMKPRVTATLWEDEGSLCFQVEAKGICVARREDNHMINGTKLLNVAGMTRGRRDGILKSEKMRHVVKIGPMHLKGVWIPFERALDFANREKITHLLYPLFVHNIGALLYHPSNQTRPTSVMAGAERRRIEGRAPQPTQPTTLQHHHTVHNPTMASHLPGPPSSVVDRPGLSRAHTFPTPPTSAHSIMGMGGPDGNYPWGGQSMNGQGGQPLSVDIGLSNARSMPSTPATTPPGNSIQTMQPYQNGGGQGYDSTRPTTYSAPPPPSNQYVSPNMGRYGQPLQSTNNQYIKHEMRPPANRSAGTGSDTDRSMEVKSAAGGLMGHGQGHEQYNPGTAEDEADQEHEHEQEYKSEYNHDANAAAAAAAAAAYGANRASYGYNTGTTVGSIGPEHAHVSPDVNGSPNHHNASSGRATPRTTTQTSQHPWGSGYHTPPRAQPASSNLYNVMSHDPFGKTTVNGTSGTGAGATEDGYHSSLGLTAMTTGYPSQQQPAQSQTPQQHSMVNGVSSSNKRVRELDDDAGRGSSRPASRGADGSGEMEGLKRRKTLQEPSPLLTGAVGVNGIDPESGRGLNRARSTIVQRRR
ncbi:MAG: hypothetical protein M1816_004995 [Peltula sp. TS41687]|nr:MAG: hypothetical protein M1816_004995 [Peltula sp. TS41687]